ncbi:MAG: pteridine reductase, partial [Paraburkholderia sp.]|uniref:pteridine reductase n=1 Tax=Paraburkholderia sp. TaxID=1926495 RepID=UPI003C64A172
MNIPVSFPRMTSSIENSSLQDHVVLITGGARRVGAEIVRALHGAGARVLIHYRDSAAAAAALAGELNQARPGSAATECGNLLDPDTPGRLIAACVREFGQLDILINNASTFFPTQVGDITFAQWDDLMGSNLKAPLFLSQAAVPSLRARRGLIINIVDIHALRPLKGHPVYSIAKAGLAMLTRSLARELGPHIRVNGIAPGPVLWPERPMDEDLKREIIAKTALKRHGTPQDIARVALFLAKDAPYITGQIIAVDG